VTGRGGPGAATGQPGINVAGGRTGTLADPVEAMVRPDAGRVHRPRPRPTCPCTCGSGHHDPERASVTALASGQGRPLIQASGDVL